MALQRWGQADMNALLSEMRKWAPGSFLEQSAAVAALPYEGKPRFERGLDTTDVEIRWIMKHNLAKNRLSRLNPGWVQRCGAILEAGK